MREGLKGWVKGKNPSRPTPETTKRAAFLCAAMCSFCKNFSSDLFLYLDHFDRQSGLSLLRISQLIIPFLRETVCVKKKFKIRYG